MLLVWSGTASEKHLCARAFYAGWQTITMTGMKRLSDESSGGRSKIRVTFRHLERTVVSVLLIIGAAALIGWVVVELYVKVVTMD